MFGIVLIDFHVMYNSNMTWKQNDHNLIINFTVDLTSKCRLKNQNERPQKQLLSTKRKSNIRNKILNSFLRQACIYEYKISTLIKKCFKLHFIL